MSLEAEAGRKGKSTPRRRDRWKNPLRSRRHRRRNARRAGAILLAHQGRIPPSQTWKTARVRPRRVDDPGEAGGAHLRVMSASDPPSMSVLTPAGMVDRDGDALLGEVGGEALHHLVFTALAER